MNGYFSKASAAALLLLTTACAPDSAQRTRALNDAALRLVGTWKVTLWLERPISFSSTPNELPLRVSGTIAFVEARYDQPSYPQLSAPTNAGVYDIDLRALGLPTSTDEAPAMVARAAHDSSTARQDSVVIVINPGSSRPALRLNGAFDRDSVVGAWTSETLLGGGGRFVLVRR